MKGLASKWCSILFLGSVVTVQCHEVEEGVSEVRKSRF